MSTRKLTDYDKETFIALAEGLLYAMKCDLENDDPIKFDEHQDELVDTLDAYN